MGDFFSGIWSGIQSAVQAAGTVINDVSGYDILSDPNSIQQAYNQVSQSYGNNYIAAQNAATAEMGRALNNFNASKPHTGADYQSFENEIQGISSTFTAYAQTLNNSRAMKGAKDVNNLAAQVIADREAERKSLSIPAATAAVTTTGTWQAGTEKVAGGGVLSNSTLIGVLIIGYLLLRRRG